MCGRYAFFDIKALRSRFGTQNELTEFKPTYNASPGMSLPLIIKQSPTRIVLKKWGLEPEWATEKKFKLINARVETIDQKSYFRQLLMNQRCLVPVNGFYEWQKETKKPFYFEAKTHEILALAGLWENETFTIITKKADLTVKPIHDRMPVILNKEAEKAWLDKENTDVTLLKLLLKSIDRESLSLKAVIKIQEDEIIYE